LKDAARKQKQADKLGVDIFAATPPPKTVTFEESINRVDAFIKPDELDEKLRDHLTKLNQLRNQLEHYAIEVDEETIIRLLAALHDPLLNLFDSQIGGIRQSQTPRIKQIWDKIETSAKFYSVLEEEVYNVMTRFQGQKVPGRLFGSEEDIVLPIFDRILPNATLSRQDIRYHVDIFAENNDKSWVVEVAGMSFVGHNGRQKLEGLEAIGRISRSQLWLVALSDVPDRVRLMAKNKMIYITGKTEWHELKTIIENSP
jgi:hypothetical protein